MAETSIFKKLNNLDVSSKVKEKNGLKYLSWSSAWTYVKNLYPETKYSIVPQVIDEFGNTRFWHDDGKTGWVEVSVTIDGLTHNEILAIMDFKNRSIPVESITSVDANKSIKRALVKCLALHGLALFLYEGEELPETVALLLELQNEVITLAKKKCALSDKAKEEALGYCKDAEKEAYPDLDDDLISGNIANINEQEILENLKKRLLKVRK